MTNAELGCGRCVPRLDFDFAMAFQPIVDVRRSQIFGHEALVRGPGGEGAHSVLSKLTPKNIHAFDQRARVKAIETASLLGINECLSINFLPNAVYDPANCLKTSLAACEAHSFPTSNIIFEITETEEVRDKSQLSAIIKEYSRHGFRTAIDDFGAGFSGLNLLAQFHPDIVKLDMELTRNIQDDRRRRTIVGGILAVCRDLEITVVAEGIETVEECTTLCDMGVDLFQGYFFARPAFKARVENKAIDYPARALTSA